MSQYSGIHRLLNFVANWIRIYGTLIVIFFLMFNIILEMMKRDTRKWDEVKNLKLYFIEVMDSCCERKREIWTL